MLPFSAISFDAKESDSLEWINGKNQKVRRETYTILAYPGEHSLGLVTIDDKTGFCRKSVLVRFCYLPWKVNLGWEESYSKYSNYNYTLSGV